ncbi:FkbM family methyltransferase [Candidatus Dependentiae bacterium]|nr:FkbM family methyltransferase [Candidatus Dependentiae bacterium]
MTTQLLQKNTLLNIISHYIPDNPIIIEAGAFDGRDTRKLSRQWPCGTIHTFEPVPDIFALLKKNTTSLSHVHCYNIALSEKTGTTVFYISEKPNKPGQPFQAGSLHKPQKRLSFSDVQYKKTIHVQTITIDDWAKQYGVNHVDFLWLDMQGHELHVLKAAPHILKTIKVIYTEVNFGQAYENQYTYEQVKQWLEKRNFQEIGRDFIDQKQWFFGNVLFVKK